eukprot:751839-Hanusia_phi.AAC.3
MGFDKLTTGVYSRRAQEGADKGKSKIAVWREGGDGAELKEWYRWIDFGMMRLEMRTLATVVGQFKTARELSWLMCGFPEGIELQDYFINYKRLKKLLRNLGAPGFTESEVKEQERVFMTNLESEIARVEEFFAAKESQYFDSYSHKLCPRVFGSTAGIQAGDASQSETAAVKGGQEENKELIQALNCSADKLRYLERFASFNLMAVVKIVKKHDKHSSTPISAKVSSNHMSGSNG